MCFIIFCDIFILRDINYTTLNCFMKLRNILPGLILILPFFLIASKTYVYAHSIDVANIDIFAYFDEKGQELPGNTFKANYYISWREILYLYEKNSKDLKDKPVPKVEKEGFTDYINTILFKYKDIYTKYIEEKVQFLNDNTKCRVVFPDLPLQDREEILVGKGIKITAQYYCDKPLSNMAVKNEMFLELFGLQTNVIKAYKQPEVLFYQAVLDKNTIETSFKMNRDGNKKDEEQLSFEEKFLRTFSNNFETSIPMILFSVFALGFLYMLRRRS